MGHSHAHHGAHAHHSDTLPAGGKAFILGIALNLAYVICEAVAGLWTHSLSLLTDAGHNLSDVASLGLSLLAFRLARAKPTRRFTYGYKKSTILAALTNAIILLVAVGILGYEAFQRIGHPQPVKGGVIAWVAGLGLVVNGLSALLFFRQRGELNARGAYLHLLADAAVSAGVVVSGILIQYTGAFWLDTLVSVIVLLVILASTWSLLTDSLHLSLDAVPRNIDPEAIETQMKNTQGVAGVSHIHLWAMSTSENAITAHVAVAPGARAGDVVARLRAGLKAAGVHHATIEVDDPATVPHDHHD